jgi:hypothetical protein
VNEGVAETLAATRNELDAVETWPVDWRDVTRAAGRAPHPSKIHVEGVRDKRGGDDDPVSRSLQFDIFE